MKQVRQGLFETNSSSSHTITIIPEDTYKKWRNHEVAVKFEWCDDYSDIYGGDDDGFLRTWGNFFLHQKEPVVCDISETKEKNIEALEAQYDWVCLNFGNIEGKKFTLGIDEYKKSGILGEILYTYASDKLYLTPEEYRKKLVSDDVISPFLYKDKGSGVVVIGTYSRS